MVKIDHLRKLDPATNIFFRVHENKFLKNLKDSWVVFIHENHFLQKFFQLRYNKIVAQNCFAVSILAPPVVALDRKKLTMI